jgi:hypothetical protein
MCDFDNISIPRFSPLYLVKNFVFYTVISMRASTWLLTGHDLLSVYGASWSIFGIMVLWFFFCGIVSAAGLFLFLGLFLFMIRCCF